MINDLLTVAGGLVLAYVALHRWVWVRSSRRGMAPIARDLLLALYPMVAVLLIALALLALQRLAAAVVTMP